MPLKSPAKKEPSRRSSLGIVERSHKGGKVFQITHRPGPRARWGLQMALSLLVVILFLSCGFNQASVLGDNADGVVLVNNGETVLNHHGTDAQPFTRGGDGNASFLSGDDATDNQKRDGAAEKNSPGPAEPQSADIKDDQVKDAAPNPQIDASSAPAPAGSLVPAKAPGVVQGAGKPAAGSPQQNQSSSGELSEPVQQVIPVKGAASGVSGNTPSDGMSQLGPMQVVPTEDLKLGPKGEKTPQIAGGKITLPSPFIPDGNEFKPQWSQNTLSDFTMFSKSDKSDPAAFKPTTAADGDSVEADRNKKKIPQDLINSTSKNKADAGNTQNATSSNSETTSGSSKSKKIIVAALVTFFAVAIAIGFISTTIRKTAAKRNRFRGRLADLDQPSINTHTLFGGEPAPTYASYDISPRSDKDFKDYSLQHSPGFNLPNDYTYRPSIQGHETHPDQLQKY